MLSMAFGGLVGVAPAEATVNLVTNGDFEQTTLSGSNGFGDRYPSNQVAGWSSNAYSFIFAPGEADTVGAEGERGHLWLWGPDYATGGGRSDNGLPDTSPAGGNFVAIDGAYEAAPLTQLITGLQAGTDYTLSFYWAAAQQMGYNGVTQQSWSVSLGDQTLQTATITNPDHAFSGWQLETMNFTATSASQLLSFLAEGTPSGAPPFTLLDGVSLQQRAITSPGSVPEPATWGMMIVGFGAVGSALRRRARKTAGALTGV
jgi:hypothetical protein